MKKYLVGGAVRDFLLNLPVTEKDWVVTGSSPQEMLNIGYEQVGKGFPVFLHPENHEEYALARTENKSGQGYTGFICYSTPFVTIEEDLYRRDLTINAMAYDMNGNLLDPYNGQRDIKLKLLRHVSDAFQEDPLRVLRVARFAAKFKNLGFTIAPETLKLIKNMIHELNQLSAERIWIETKKALSTDTPQVYFQVLHQCGGLKILFPELDILFSIPNLNQKNSLKNISLGEYTMKNLQNIAHLTPDLNIRFSILFCNLNDTNNLLTKHSDHYSIFVKHSKILYVNNLCNRLKIPNSFHKLSKIVSIYFKYLNNITTLSPNIIMSIFNAFDCWKNAKNIDQIIHINKSKSLTNQDDINYISIQENFLRTAFEITTQTKVNDIIKDGFTGSNIRKELYNRRLSCLIKWKRKNILNHHSIRSNK